MHTIHAIRKNSGGTSAVVLIFTVTLGLMAMAGAALIQREGNAVGRTVLNMQGDYAAQAGIKYGLERFKNGAFSEYEELSGMGDLTVYMDTTGLVNDPSGCQIKLSVTATDGDIAYVVDGYVKVGEIDKAGVVNGAVTDVWVYRESGTKDPTYLPSGVDVPEMDEDVLIAMANAQNQNHDSTNPPIDWTGTSYGSFWFAVGIPNVTYVEGNLTVPSGVTVYGLLLVGGNVTISGSGSIEGVILQPNATSLVILSSYNGEIRGGVISQGSVDGNKLTFLGFELAASKVKERATYITEANDYLNNEPRLIYSEMNPD